MWHCPSAMQEPCPGELESMGLLLPDPGPCPAFFPSWRLHEDSWFAHALALECILHPGHTVVITPAFDPRLVQPAQVESIVDWLLCIASLVATKPDSNMRDLPPEIFHGYPLSVDSGIHATNVKKVVFPSLVSDSIHLESFFTALDVLTSMPHTLPS